MYTLLQVSNSIKQISHYVRLVHLIFNSCLEFSNSIQEPAKGALAGALKGTPQRTREGALKGPFKNP